MENKEDDIEDLFRERFENDEAPVSPRVWQNIKKTLPEDKDSFGFTFSQNIVLWSIIGVLLTGAVMGSFLYFSKGSGHSSYSPLSLKTADQSIAEGDYNHDSNASVVTKTNAEALENIPSDHSTKSKSTASVKSLTDKTNSNLFHSDTTKKIDYSNADTHTPIKKARNVSSSSSTSLAPSAHPTAKRQKNKSTSTSNHSALTQNSSDKISRIGTSKPIKNKNVATYSLQSNSADATVKMNTKEQTSSDTNGILQHSKLAKHSTTSSSSATSDSKPSTYDSSSQSTDQHPAHSMLTDSISTGNTTVSPLHSDQLTFANEIKTHSTDAIDSSVPDKLIHQTTSRAIAKPDSSAGNNLSYTTASTADTNTHLPGDSSSNSLLSKDSSLAIADSIQDLKKDSVLAETNTRKEKASSTFLHKISIDLVAAALITGASTKAANDSLQQSAVTEKNKSDKNSWGYSAGLVLNYPLSNRLKISSGVIYNTFAEQYNFHYTLKKTIWTYVDSSWQSTQVDSINRTVKAKDEYRFISVPLQISYTFLNKNKLTLSATAGIRTNILLKGMTYLPNASKTNVIEMKSGFNTLSFSYLLALEAAYKLTEHSALLLQPVFVYGASSIHNKASGINQKPYGWGLTVGLRFNF